MTATRFAFDPDYAVSPGQVLEDELEAREISQAEFARRCGYSAKHISEIISGKAPVAPDTAIRFQQVLGIDAGVWLGIEANYRLRLARLAEVERLAQFTDWAEAFPIKELVARNLIPAVDSGPDAVAKLLSFFGTGSVGAWRVKYASTNVSYRHSPAFESDEAVLATWLRLGELESEQAECATYSESAFRAGLRAIRGLTRGKFNPSFQEAQKLCHQSGVVLTVIKPFPKTALSGAAWWVSSRKAVVQLSARHLSDDHLWFSFFHEAAHILLHSKRDVFIDLVQSRDNSSFITEADGEADAWVREFLISNPRWERFISSSKFTASTVRQFAEAQEIAPSLVVGRLQHEGHIGWNQLNGLKTKLRWN